jgi:multicomponent Na+:H+ antiporter subunit E
MTALLVPALSRLALLALLWVILTSAAPRGPVVAGISVAAATAASIWLWPLRRRRIRWSQLPPLIAYFLWGSLKGGIDVARRAFSPAMPLDPGVIHYESRLESETGRVFFTWMIGLMPGTASVGLDSSTIRVHVIDGRTYGADSLRPLERRLAAVLESPHDFPQ